MARISSDQTLSTPRPSSSAAAVTDRAQPNSYGHGHVSSIGHGHAMLRDALQPAAPAIPVALRVTVVTAVDEAAAQPVALGLRVHREDTALRPSLFPPRRGQRLPQRGLPSTDSQRLAMVRGHTDALLAARAISILAK